MKINKILSILLTFWLPMCVFSIHASRVRMTPNKLLGEIEKKTGDIKRAIKKIDKKNERLKRENISISLELEKIKKENYFGKKEHIQSNRHCRDEKKEYYFGKRKYI